MKLVLLGTAETMKDAPYTDPTWEIWACQPALGYPACKRVDRLFELHDETYWKDPNILTRINVRGAPVMMQRKVPEIPTSEELPLQAMIDKFSPFIGKKYYTSTIAYMLAYALYLAQYEVIALYGVHMAADEEYGTQRQSMEYWVGVANGMGVKVIVPPESAICNAKFLYGYDVESTMLTEMRKMSEEINKHIAESKSRVDSDVQTLYEYGGAAKMLAKLRRIYS